MASATLSCASCGANNQVQARFCRACGRPLQTGKQPLYNSVTGQLLTNILLRQRYRVIEPIGQGGFGAVYRAEDTLLGNRLVALKEMSQRDLNPQRQQEAAKAFEQKALILARLQHPNLPNIFDHFEENHRWYLVMSFIQGETLENYLSRKPDKKLPLNEVVDIGTQLCAVLGYLHQQQPPIIFRDLKPANIMRTSDGYIYLIDFGIARHFKLGHAKDTVSYGSNGYASPEQYGKSQTTPRSDIYSLGATLHQLLSGHDPSSTPFHFPPLRSLTPPVPANLATFITQMLEMDEEKRPANVLLVKQALQASTSQALVNAKPPQSNRVSSTSSKPIGTLIQTIGHEFYIKTIAWSPDGKYLASGSWDTVYIFEALSGTLVTTYTGHNKAINAVAWSPDGKHLASSSKDETVQVFDASGMLVSTIAKTTVPAKSLIDNELLPYLDRERPVTWSPGENSPIAWSPDGKFLACSISINEEWERTWFELCVLDAFSVKMVSHTQFEYENDTPMVWSPDGKYLACRGKEKDYKIPFSIAVSTALTGMNVTSIDLKNDLHTITWSPNKKYIAVGGGDIRVFAFPPKISYENSAITTYTGHEGSVNTITWSPDGKYIASGGEDKTVQIFEALSGKMMTSYKGHKGSVYTVAWSPDGKYLASGGEDETVQIWVAQ